MAEDGAMTAEPLPMLLVPGAWMGAWIWQGTIDRLRVAGCRAQTLTLPGLQPEAAPADRAAITLDDHVAAVVQAIDEVGERVLVIGHSYSGVLAGMVADRRPDLVPRIAVVCGFFPRPGRSLLDDWGSAAQERADERAEIERVGMLWAPPPAAGLAADPSLDEADVEWLAQRLVPHPGRAILAPVTMRCPVSEQAVTVIADVGDGDRRSTLPADLADADLSRWDFRPIPAGHWPMLGCPDALEQALVDTATRAAEISPPAAG